jgi:hypothetical protein
MKLKKLREWKHRHWGEHAMIAIMLIGAAVDWTPVSDTTSSIIGWVVGGAMVVAFIVHLSHLRGALCEDCMEAMPLDGHEAARQRKPLLRGFHRLYDGKNTMPLVLLGMVGITVLNSFLFKERSAPNLVVNNLITLGIIGIYVVNGVHRRLHPWCPWCHWDDGGEEEPSPDPIVPETV